MSETNGVEADQSAQLNELAAALAKAQGQIEGAKKDSLNPHFKNKYADLASVWDACRAALSSNGLAVIQLPGSAGKDVMVTTLLLHSSGQFIRSRYVMPVSQPGPQGVGSAITYARRYSLAAMVGVAPEDDDATAAVGRPPTRETFAKPETSPVLPPVAGRTAQIKEKLAQRKIVDVKDGESEREAEARTQASAFERIRELGKRHGIEGVRMVSHVKGCGITKTDPATYTEKDYDTVAASLAYLNGGSQA